MGRNRHYVQLDPDVIEQARQMDLLSYLQRYEPDNLKHVARNVYCTREHDSLKISNGKWYWWSRGFGGVSALDYLIKVKEYSFVEAVEALAGITAGWSPPPVSAPKEEPKVLLLPPRNKDCDRVTQYLSGRGIDFLYNAVFLLGHLSEDDNILQKFIGTVSDKILLNTDKALAISVGLLKLK